MSMPYAPPAPISKSPQGDVIVRRLIIAIAVLLVCAAIAVTVVAFNTRSQTDRVRSDKRTLDAQVRDTKARADDANKNASKLQDQAMELTSGSVTAEDASLVIVTDLQNVSEYQHDIVGAMNGVVRGGTSRAAANGQIAGPFGLLGQWPDTARKDIKALDDAAATYKAAAK